MIATDLVNLFSCLVPFQEWMFSNGCQHVMQRSTQFTPIFQDAYSTDFIVLPSESFQAPNPPAKPFTSVYKSIYIL